MDIPNESHPAWMQIISEQTFPEFKCLATKVLIGRLKLRYKKNPTPDIKQDCIDELRVFFQRHQKFPKVLSDLNVILSGRTQS
jgi:hypothetical protein